MRFCWPLTLTLLLTGTGATAEDVFKEYRLFPGPNPEIYHLLPKANLEYASKIGHVLIENVIDSEEAIIDEPVTDISQLPSVAQAIKAATPPPHMTALVNQQLKHPHRFDFRRLTIVDGGDHGLIWNVVYDLMPDAGGHSGTPWFYCAVLDGRARATPQRLSVFDVYFHSHQEGWTCTLLELPTTPVPEEQRLPAEDVRQRAMNALVTQVGKSDLSLAAGTRAVFKGQEQVRIPVATDEKGAIVYSEIWAVNFVDPADAEREEYLTMWATQEGKVAEIRSLQLWR